MKISSEQMNEFKPIISPEIRFKFLKKDERGRFYIVENARKEGKPVYLRVHEAGKEIIGLMNGELSLSQIGEALKKKNIEVDLIRFVRFLGRKGIIQNYPYVTERETEEKAKLRVRNFSIFKNPEKFIAWIYLPLKFLFNGKMLVFFITFNLVISLFSGVCILLDKLELGSVLNIYTSSFFAFLLYMLLLFPLLAILHELAHTITCFHYGGRIGEIGISIYLFAPFLYADTSGAWMLSKKQSVMVFLAGPLMTLFTGNVSFLLQFFVTFPLKNVLLMITFASYFSTIFGLNPLMEMDGYYVLQTLTDFPNLHSNAWEFVGKWLKRKIRIDSERKYQESLSCYSQSERKILSLYTPLVVATNLVFITITTYWAFLLINGYINLTLQIIKELPIAKTTNIALWIFETLYLGIISFVILQTTRRIVTARIKNSYKG